MQGSVSSGYVEDGPHNKPSIPIPSSAPFYLIAAHAGAGVHLPSTHAAVRKALRIALAAPFPSPIHLDALAATTHILSSLEAAEPLNAGYGSNLTFDGAVECDAALMDGANGAFGSVGAVRGVRSPAAAAHAVLQARRAQADALGRVMPLMLVGDGARAFAEENRVSVCDTTALVSPRAKREWEFWKREWELVRESGEGERGPRAALRARQDTVGAIVLDSTLRTAAGVSSGGLLLKIPGRVGEAAIYGAGCWADDRIACSITGLGELIIQSSVARTIAEAVEDQDGEEDVHDILNRVLVDKFYRKWKSRGEPQPDIGVLLVRRQAASGGTKVRLWCAFTTPSMAFAYATSQQPKPKTVILTNPVHTYDDDTRPPFFISQISL